MLGIQVGPGGRGDPMKSRPSWSDQLGGHGGSKLVPAEELVPAATPPRAAVPGCRAAAGAGKRAGGEVSIKSPSISRAGWCLL